MNARRIRTLVAELAKHPSSPTLVNPYTSRERQRNLASYLAALLAFPYSGHLLVGEAPGYRGCAITGIPFTDERILRSGTHRFLKSIRDRISVRGRAFENTASIVWSHLETCDALPAFWNAVPFHPCVGRQSNRAPSVGEIRSGLVFLKHVIRILSPHCLVAVGRKAEFALGLLNGVNFRTVRHPSHGGKHSFVSGLAAAGIASRAPQAGRIVEYG